MKGQAAAGGQPSRATRGAAISEPTRWISAVSSRRRAPPKRANPVGSLSWGGLLLWYPSGFLYPSKLSPRKKYRAADFRA